MATDSVLGLFTDPNQYLQQQSAATDQRASQFAQMTPMQQAQYGIYGGASRLGGGLAGLMGVEDPQMKAIAQQQKILQGVDYTDLKSLQEGARSAVAAGRPDIAQALAAKALEHQKLIEDRTAQRETQLEAVRLRNEAKMEEIKANNAARMEEAIRRGADQKELKGIELQGRREMVQLAASLKGEKAPTVDDKSATRIGQNTVFESLINEGNKLTEIIDQNKDAFSLGGRAATAVKSVMNPSAPSVQAVSDVDSYMKKARNAYLLAAKGTQTEGDAQRAWDEFAGKLDFSSAEGAKRSVERIKNELTTQKQANEAYLKSRGVSSGAALGTKENPIKLK